MLIDFETLPEVTIPHLNGGEGSVSACMAMLDGGKAMFARIKPGCSIGMHTHETSDDISYVLSGCGTAVCDGVEESLRPGTCHVCQKGSSHSVACVGDQDLVLFTVVPER